MKIADIIKKYREENNISGRQFATNAGLSNAYISLIENGETKSPTIDSLFKIAKGMNMSLDELLKLMDDNATISVKAKKTNDSWYSNATDNQKANMQRRTLEDIKVWFDESTYELLADYLQCSTEGKKWANERLSEAVKLYPKDKE